MAQVQYASIAELISLSLTEGSAQRFNDAAMTSALQYASSMADDYFRSTYILPLVSWDMSLKKVVCDIAAKSLFDSFGFAPDAPQDRVITKRYEEALEWLDKVSKKLIWPSFMGSSNESTPFVISNTPVGFATYNNGTIKRRLF